MFMCDNNEIFRELDIVFWKFRYPVLLQNTMLVQLLIHLRLLLISDFYISSSDLLINDVLRIMCVDQKEICILTVDQINTLILPIGFICHCWWIGTAVLCDFRGICLNTPSLSILKNDVKAKRNLWLQISQNINFLHK